MSDKKIILKGGEYYLTENDNDAYRVLSGNVMVFIVPLHKSIGRRSFVYEAKQGETIPGFAYKDIEYCNWRFCLVAVDQAEIQILEDASTKVLKTKFCEKASIKNFKIEGYNNGLVDQYRMNIVSEDSFIRRTEINKENTAKRIITLLYNAFDKKKINEKFVNTKCSIYNAMYLLCDKSKIDIVPYEKAYAACGDNIKIEDIARLSQFAYREVLLIYGWEKTDSGAFIVFDSNNKPLVCLPKNKSSYVLYNAENGEVIPVTKNVALSLNPKAYMIYRPLPSNSLSFKDVFRYCLKSIDKKGLFFLLILTITTSVIGLLTPIISQTIYDEYIPLGITTLLFQVSCMLGAFMIANIMFLIVKSLVSFRMTSRLSYDFQSAVYSRLFRLPESFFRKYESADLAQRVIGAGSIVNSVSSTIIISAVAIVFIIIYFVNMVSYSVKLAFIGLLMLLIYCVVYYIIGNLTIKKKKEAVEIEGKSASKIYQLLNGISKIRIAGVEDRALYEYLKPYVNVRNIEEKIQKINGIETTLTVIINTIFSLVFYIIVTKTDVDISLGAFIAFNTIFGSFSMYFMQLVNGVIDIKRHKPEINRIKPIVKAVPEIDSAKELPGDITGEIEINSVSFAYDKDSPNVLNNLTLNIKSGEYIGIVGSSGCGKSTLLKLLLGFESPTSGKIYFDNKDIESVDKCELRKKMGVVLQDGKLISGSIFENITITSPSSTLKDVREVVKAVGLEKDIDEMPMGLHTVLSEDCGTISGGQQQRILIARAIISKPNILFFDEATSALDNVTQSMVTSTIEKMNSTRIVIAHRLSTIINCDRIIVMDKGTVSEEGSYEELMNKKGLFYNLASRQIS